MTNEAVLVIPMVLALLGDNPMQSEFACHIGLKGKLFCQACWVKGFDGLAESDEDEDVASGVNSRQAEASDDTQEQESNGTIPYYSMKSCINTRPSLHQISSSFH